MAETELLCPKSWERLKLVGVISSSRATEKICMLHDDPAKTVNLSLDSSWELDEGNGRKEERLRRRTRGVMQILSIDKICNIQQI